MTINVPGETVALCLVTPVFNDWGALAHLLSELETVLWQTGVSLDVVAVNDASVSLGGAPFDSDRTVIEEITVLDLHANVGHQMAIAVGLQYAQQHRKCDAVLIMDADGEDRPTDVPKLVAAWRTKPDHLVVAERTKRSESFIFRVFYLFYRSIFRTLTGHSISFGNFALIPAPLLPALLSRPERIHHIAATLLRTRLPITKVPTIRGTRYVGVSQMNMSALVLHAVAALSVFSDVLFSRLLIIAALVCTLCGIGSLIVAVLRLFTSLAFPNWATTVISFLALLAAQTVIMILCAGFLLLTSRSTMFLASLEVSRILGGVRSYNNNGDAADKA